MVKKKLANKILSKYFQLSFPGSFQGVAVFQQSLKDNLNITISRQALRRLLKSSLYYQVNFIKPQKFKHRPLVTRGVGIEAYCDTVFVPLKNGQGNGSKRFIFLVVADVHSRFLWSRKLDEVTKENVINAFSQLFKSSMPLWPILRVDRDLVINSLKTTYFARKNILLRTRRSVTHMGFLEGIIRNIKRKFIQNMRKNEDGKVWSQKRLVRALHDVTYSYNHTVSSSHGMIPAEVNSSKYDAELRLKLYGPQVKLKRFESFYFEQLKLRKKANG